MNPTLVIGIGNTIRGDDGAGIRVVEQLAGRFPGVDVMCVHQLSPEHAEKVSQYERLVIVDASVTTDTLRVTPLRANGDVRLPRTHNVSPGGILALAETLYRKTPADAILVEIPASSCDFTEELSSHTASVVEEAVGTVATYVMRS